MSNNSNKLPMDSICIRDEYFYLVDEEFFSVLEERKRHCWVRDDISDKCMNITDNIIYPIDSNSNIDDIINTSSSSVSMIGLVNSDHNTIPDGI